MTDANKRANVASELARADESMRAARVLVDAALLHDAESRLYYAIYHAESYCGAGAQVAI